MIFVYYKSQAENSMPLQFVRDLLTLANAVSAVAVPTAILARGSSVTASAAAVAAAGSANIANSGIAVAARNAHSAPVATYAADAAPVPPALTADAAVARCPLTRSSLNTGPTGDAPVGSDFLPLRVPRQILEIPGPALHSSLPEPATLSLSLLPLLPLCCSHISGRLLLLLLPDRRHMYVRLSVGLLPTGAQRVR